MEDTSTKEKAQAAFVRQRDETTCGVACLAAVIRYYGKEVKLEHLWARSGASRQGTTLLGLYEAAQAVGLDAGAYEADLDNLKALDAPCVLHVVQDQGVQRFVVCYGYERERFILGDPAAGVRECSPTKLGRLWQSRALLTLEPTASFEEKIADENACAAASPPASGQAVGRRAVKQYRCSVIDPTPFGENQVALRSPRTDKTHVLPSVWAQLLLSLDRFDTVENHAATCLQRMTGHAAAGNPSSPSASEAHTTESTVQTVSSANGLEMAHVKRQLAQFAEDGLLVSKDKIHSEIQSLSHPPVDAASNAITSVGIPTRNRTESLRRALASYVENTQHHGRSPEFVVMDDAGNAEIQEQNRHVLQELKQRYGADLSYANRRQRERFAETLARCADVPPAVTRFALLGNERCATTYGATRNALVLHAAGEVCLQVDDDTVCKVVAAPEVKAGLALTSQVDACAWWFFEDRREALASVSFTDKDFLGVHEELLGKTFVRCLCAVENNEGELHVGDVDADFIKHMHADGASVAVSFTGAVGDSGMRSNLARVFLEGATFERLVQTVQAYRTNLDTRDVLRASVRPSITNGLSCMTMNIGLDHRTLLPPFMPVGRNEDGIFGAVLKLCFKSAYRGYMPYGVLHDPLEARVHNTEEIRFEHFNANDILLRLMLSFDPWPRADGASALQTLGRYLEDLGSLSLAAFEDYVSKTCRQAAGRHVARAQRRLGEEEEAPTDWIEDVQRYIQTVQEAIVESDIAVPVDLPGSMEEKWALLRELVHSYGELLIHWPAVRKAALELRKGGGRLARTL